MQASGGFWGKGDWLEPKDMYPREAVK